MILVASNSVPTKNLYVAEAVWAATSTVGLCDQVARVGPKTGGFTARIVRIGEHGTVTVVADNLPDLLRCRPAAVASPSVGFIG
jgi:hypothetical protein